MLKVLHKDEIKFAGEDQQEIGSLLQRLPLNQLSANNDYAIGPSSSNMMVLHIPKDRVTLSSSFISGTKNASASPPAKIFKSHNQHHQTMMMQQKSERSSVDLKKSHSKQHQQKPQLSRTVQQTGSFKGKAANALLQQPIQKAPGINNLMVENEEAAGGGGGIRVDKENKNDKTSQYSFL